MRDLQRPGAGREAAGRAAAFAAGLRWAVDNGMHVANLSLSSGGRRSSRTFHRLADEAYFADGAGLRGQQHAGADLPVAVRGGAVGGGPGRGDDPFDFDYNPDPPVEFGAPGGRRRRGLDRRAGPSGRPATASPARTSPALVARLLSKHPGLTPFQVKTVLHALASNARAVPARG